MISPWVSKSRSFLTHSQQIDVANCPQGLIMRPRPRTKPITTPKLSYETMMPSQNLCPSFASAAAPSKDSVADCKETM